VFSTDQIDPIEETKKTAQRLREQALNEFKDGLLSSTALMSKFEYIDAFERYPIIERRKRILNRLTLEKYRKNLKEKILNWLDTR
jgi:hypothetical protein